MSDYPDEVRDIGNVPMHLRLFVLTLWCFLLRKMMGMAVAVRVN